MKDLPCILAASRSWLWGMPDRLLARTARFFHLVHFHEELTTELLERLNPRYVFFPHWSWSIPEEIWAHFECVIFHMTDLPFGRGGSPLQNLISRGIYETYITALRCEAGLDTGPVYMKRPLCLHGSAEEIFLRAADIMEDMIADILANEPDPTPQQGAPVIFKRRGPEESDMAGLMSLKKVHDHIRMLDAEGYPVAFLESGAFRLEFRQSSLRYGKVEATVTITLKDA